MSDLLWSTMSNFLRWEGMVLENRFHCLAKKEEVNTIQEFLSSAKLPGEYPIDSLYSNVQTIS